MSKTVLLNILENLKEDEFESFKWHLSQREVSDMGPIKVSKLEKAAKRDVVDLMVQNYEAAGAVEVTESVLKKIDRKDLVTDLGRVTPGAEGAGPGGALGPPAEDKFPADDRLYSVRIQFVNRVSGAVLNQLLDKLLERHIINDEEMQAVRTKAERVEKARDMIDTVRRKGPGASSVLISALREVDPCLSRELKLI